MRSNQYLVDWAITNRRNLNCLHCSGMASQELDDEKVLKVAEQVPSLKRGKYHKLVENMEISGAGSVSKS